jgi:outer membrane protein assembly factor BamB
MYLHWVRQLPAQKPAWPDQQLLQFDAAPQPVALGQTLFVPSARTDGVTALDAHSGEELWKFTANGPVRFAPAVWDDRIFFSSDDGYLYCVDAESGQLLWKKRGGPSDRLVLGNERLISTWPARGAPVIVNESTLVGREATVYFAAGIWPFMGIFLHALDARTGDVVWTNDGDGSLFIRQPHQAEAFAGVAPQGQLIVMSDRLLVPGGRSVPACYDRHTGKLRHFRLADNSKRGGGPFVKPLGHLFVNGKGIFDLETGLHVSACGEHTAVGTGLLYSWSAGGCQTLDLRDTRPPVASSKMSSFLLGSAVRGVQLASTSVPRIDVLIRAGARLVAGRPGQVMTFDLPLRPGRAEPRWQARVDGQPVHLLAAEDCLFVTTREGRLYCFGAGRQEVVEHPLPERAQPQADDWTGRTHDLLEQTGVRRGYCVVWGAGSGRLVEELLAQSQLFLIVLEDKEPRAQSLRERLMAAGIYGDRVQVHCGDLHSLQLPPYLANLMVSEDLAAAGVEAGPEFVRRAYASLQPYGGVMCLPLPEGQRPDLGSLPSLDVDLVPMRVRSHGDWLLISRAGPLPGAGNWTHEHGDAANTRVSLDSRVKAPLGLLWFGGPTHEGVLPRHGHGPQPQVIDGRVILEGVDMLRAQDVYTGRMLWEFKLPSLGKLYDSLAHQPGANACGTNYISTADGVYVLYQSVLLRLDLDTGRELARFPLPAVPGVKGPLVWSYLNVCDNYLITGANPPAIDAKAKSKALSSSMHLLVLNRQDGRLLWRLSAQNGFRNNTLCAGSGRLYAIDRASGDLSIFLKRKASGGQSPARLLALDLPTGRLLWSNASDVFGTWLSYSGQREILMEAGRVARDTLTDEPRGMRAWQAGTGKILWTNKQFAGPAMIHGDRVLYQNGACDTLTGAPYVRPDPLTGQPVEWTWTRMYGCNTPLASEHLLTFRSGAAGFYDLCHEGGTGNFGGFRSGCTNNLIVAGGVLCAPDYTRTCTCSYQNQTSVALVPMADAEMWTFQSKSEVKGIVRRVGLLLGAPGNRRADDGTLWLAYPPTGGPSPRLAVRTEPVMPEFFRHHSSRIESGSPAWLAACGARGLRSLTINLAGPTDQPRLYRVRLVFVEPDSLPVGQRVFDVGLQGETICSSLDVCREAGGPNRLLMKEFRRVRAGQALTIQLTPTNSSLAEPVLCSVEIIKD